MNHYPCFQYLNIVPGIKKELGISKVCHLAIWIKGKNQGWKKQL